MKIDVVISADHIKQEYLKEKSVVIIDVLRATSVITTALANGAKEVIPTLTVEEAFEKKKEVGERSLLAGERQAKRIEGFELSNSPLEFTKDKVKDKTIILSTTNGTRALTLANTGDRIFIASILNAKAIAKKLIEIGKDIVIINAGTNGNFSTDDFICCGYIISEIKNSTSCNLTDIARVSMDIYDNNSDIEEYIKNATHYGVLLSLGLEEDIYYCCKKDLFDIVPEYIDGRLKIL
ncbi:MAG: 2-phosphosulfolactate phosphatase [Sarcina sp.]